MIHEYCATISVLIWGNVGLCVWWLKNEEQGTISTCSSTNAVTIRSVIKSLMFIENIICYILNKSKHEKEKWRTEFCFLNRVLLHLNKKEFWPRVESGKNGLCFCCCSIIISFSTATAGLMARRWSLSWRTRGGY